jgi:hypothetical protein
MHWILQDNFKHEAQYVTLINALERFNIPYSIHKVIPFVGKLMPDYGGQKNAICFGAYSMRHIAKEQNLYPGVFDLEPFDYTHQFAHWGDRMLNASSVVSRLADAVFPDEQMFIRPIQDSKCFSGGVMDRPDFNHWRDQMVKEGHAYGYTIDADTMVQVAPLTNIYAEYRYWIVDGKIITKSMYKMGTRVIYSDQVNEAVDAYVQECVDIWQPLRAFVIDVCETPDGFRIVEINTMNAAGFYCADVTKLMFALEMAFTEQT